MKRRVTGHGLSPARRRRARAHLLLIVTAFVLFWIPVIIFAKLADDVSERQPLTIDTSLIGFFHQSHSPLLDHVALFLTSLGEPLVVAAAGLALVALCIYKKWYRGAAALIGSVGGAVIANLILKAIFARSRPSLFTPLIVETDYSFPSGHAMVSSAFVGIVVLLLWHTRLRTTVIVIGALGTILIGLSRIYLGVHYPSDVLAGWCVGLIWAALAGSLALNRPFGLGRRLAPLIHRQE